MKRFALIVALVIFACACHAAVDTSGLRVYNLRSIRSESNPKGAWRCELVGDHYIFTGPKGARIDSAKDNAKLLNVIVDVAHNKPIVTSADLAADAEPGMLAGRSIPIIGITLKEPAARRFAEFTKKNVGAMLAMLINGKLISAPVLREPIVDGHFELSGMKDEKQARQIADAINRSRRQPSATQSSQDVSVQKGKDIHHQYREFDYVERRGAGFTQVYGTIGSNVRWTKAKSPYLVTENVYVAEEGVLTIDPGVVVKFVPPTDTARFDTGFRLSVSGRLMAEGTPKERIVFTSAAQEPRPARDWGGIQLLSQSPSVLTWAVVRYGSCNWVQGCALVAHCVFEHCHSAVWAGEHAIAEIRNNVCAYSAYSGVRSQMTQPYCFITDNILYRNSDGVDCWGIARAYMDYNLVFGNRTQYFQFATPSPHDVQLDPLFVDAEKSDYRLAAGSPARGAGSSGGDIGLCEDAWSPASAKLEKDRFLADGAMELWMKARDRRAHGSDPAALYRQAMAAAREPSLRDRIACDFADDYLRHIGNDQAKVLASDVLRTSKLPHLRDWARRLLARAAVDERDYEAAIRYTEQVEWPQSKVWTDLDLPVYLAMAGRTEAALALLEKSSAGESDGYISALKETISVTLGRGHLDNAKAVLAGFGKYPMCPEAAKARLDVAVALRKAQRYDEALELLKENDAKDPLNVVGAENLYTMAELLKDGVGRKDEAAAVVNKLIAGYIKEDEFVQRGWTLLEGDPLPVPKDKLILLDESQGESSLFDRCAIGNCNNGQWIGACALRDAGYLVHTNGRILAKNRLTPEMLSRYGLVIMHGRYGASDRPPMPETVIGDLVSYVESGGVLMVIAAGPGLGAGREAEYYNPLMKRFGPSFTEGGSIPNNLRAKTLSGVWPGEPFEFVPYGGVEVNGGEALARYGSTVVAARKSRGKGVVIALGGGAGFRDGSIDGRTRPDVAATNKAAFVRFAQMALPSR